MRKVTATVVGAFLQRRPAKMGNTRTDGDTLYLHENAIARWAAPGELRVTLAGWDTPTTRNRLNALPNVSVYRVKGKTHLNGAPWSGDWRPVYVGR